jgi:radical SAM-linked protein
MTGFAPPGTVSALPVTQRLIVRYAKRGRMRFASHRDIARAVERGVRRAQVPIAYSAGFNPHPKISYAGAAPTGTASEAEYLELSLTQRCAASEVRERLDAALPDGIDVIEVTEGTRSSGGSALGGTALGDAVLEVSQWQVTLPGVSPADAARAVAAFLACGELEVERLTSKGIRRMDARGPVLSIETGRDAHAGLQAGNAILRMVVRHVTPAVRPDDILAALRRVAALAPSSPPLVTRLAQGALGTGPFARWPSAGGGEARSTSPGGQPPGLPGAGQSGAAGTVETTRPGDGTAEPADTHPAGACNQLPRGAGGSLGDPAPGSLTGDCPDARQRAARLRVRP